MSKKTLIVGGSVVFSFALGAVIGYAVARKELDIQYRERADEEIAEARAYYSRYYKKEEFATVEDAAEALLPKRTPGDTIPEDRRETETDKEYRPPHDIETLEKMSRGLKYRSNHVAKVLSQAPAEDQPYDWSNEVDSRDESVAHIISIEEFKAGDKNYQQPDLTYFEGDGVLMYDLTGEKIDDVDEIVGLANLQRFGHQSNEINVVYVRNNIEEKDFSITKEEGSYAEKVGGSTESGNSRQRHHNRRSRG